MKAEDTRQCALCETLRPESKMTRKGRLWVCADREACDKGIQVRDEAAKTDQPPRRDTFYGNRHGK